MLQPMQQPAASPSPSPNFAGMLAAFSAPGQKRPPASDLDGFEDDVATLSYERALRAQARYRTPEQIDLALAWPALAKTETPAETRLVSIFEVSPAPDVGDQPSVAKPAVAFSAAVEPEPDHDRNLKSASITIRLSKTECAQLRKRAAEAGLTMSAYLRSCTFEAESLRALVKETLAKLRHESPEKGQDATPAEANRRFGWLRRLWPHANARQQIVRA